MLRGLKWPRTERPNVIRKSKSKKKGYKSPASPGKLGLIEHVLGVCIVECFLKKDCSSLLVMFFAFFVNIINLCCSNGRNCV